jgi:phosphoglucomutase
MTGGHISPLAGRPLDRAQLIDASKLVGAYFSGRPDPSQPSQRVHFGTSGHRGSAFTNSFNEGHVLAIAQAICLYRDRSAIHGPMFVGIDTHALSRPALATVLEVFAANGVSTMVDERDGYTPTPVISHAILTHNRAGVGGLADGVVLTPSHNPPQDGGFKYNPPSGGPADTEATGWIEQTANAFLESRLEGVRRIPYERARVSPDVHRQSTWTPSARQGSPSESIPLAGRVFTTGPRSPSDTPSPRPSSKM